MLIASYVVAVSVLTLLPLLFLVARSSAKRMMRLAWSVDDTLLLLSLVELASWHDTRRIIDTLSDMPVSYCCGIRRGRVIATCTQIESRI
jgi:fumarate reductase subunit D